MAAVDSHFVKIKLCGSGLSGSNGKKWLNEQNFLRVVVAYW